MCKPTALRDQITVPNAKSFLSVRFNINEAKESLLMKPMNLNELILLNKIPVSEKIWCIVIVVTIPN